MVDYKLLGMAVMVVMLVASHYFAGAKRMHKLVVYTAGVLCIIGGFAVNTIPQGNFEILIELIQYCIVAGIVTWGLYLLDAFFNLRANRIADKLSRDSSSNGYSS